MNRVYRVLNRSVLCPGRGCERVRTVSPRTVSRGTGDTVTLRSSKNDQNPTPAPNRGGTQSRDTVPPEAS